jgi:Na+/H+-dicarboxylate symporter
MKIWMKYLLGTVFGILAALLLPVQNPPFPEAIGFLANLAIRIGRYAVLPLVFFTLASSVYELLETRRLYKPFGFTFLLIILSSFILSLVGAASILLIKSPRIPISVDRVTETVSLGAGQLLEAIFPYSGFAAVLNENFLLPAFILALLTGVACTREKQVTKPVVFLLAGAVKVVTFISHVTQDIMTIGMIAITCRFTILFSGILVAGTYNALLCILLLDFAILALVIYPGVTWLLCRKNPLWVLYQSVASVLAAFFSGDTNFVLPLAMRHCSELIGNRSNIAPFSTTLFSIFARGGSALTSSICFVIILHSYSNLSLAGSTIVWVVVMSFLLSFLLAGIPSGGAFVLLTVLCTRHGQGFEASYLLLRPAAPLICAFACALDVLTNIFGSYIVAHKLGMASEY